MFAFNSSYIGSRLGICWEILAEKHKEFHDAHVRDPYPLIAEKAGLEKGRNVSRILRSVAVGNEKYLWSFSFSTNKVSVVDYTYL